MPVRSVLREGVDDLAVQRAWRKVQRRRHDELQRASRPRRAGRLVRAALLAVPSVAFACFAFAAVASPVVRERVAAAVIGAWASTAPRKPASAAAAPVHVSSPPTASGAPVVTEPAAAEPVAPVESAASEAAPAVPVESLPVAKHARAAPSSLAWQDLARRGSYAEAYGALGAHGIERVSDSGEVADLLAVADVARLSGHPIDAVAPLARVVTDHRADPRAPLAAFTLGRVQADTLGNPSAAAQAFALAITLGLPSGLVEDAFARLVETRAHAGDRAGARAAAEAYRERFPDGVHAAAIDAWTAAP
jgi:transmembrane sensor